MKVNIIGAGMGGLSAGIALKRGGHEVQIFEKVDTIRPVGAAISLWPNGVKCLNHLGLTDALAAVGGQLDRMAYHEGLSGRTMTQFSLQPLIDQAGERPYPVARAALQDMLLHAFGPEDVRLGMPVAQVQSDDDGVVASFANGERHHSDILIGADGAHSVVRAHVLGAQPERRYAGYVNWNGLVAADTAIGPLDQWTTYVGQGKRASVMPVADGRFYFFFDVPLPKGLPNERALYKATLRDAFAGWAAPVQTLIDRIDEAETNRVEIHDVDPFMTWTRGRVALLGDAAHSMTPDIGQGGCAAMEDAIVLARALQTPTLGPTDALARYAACRVERARDLVMRARKRCDITHGKDPAATQAWYDELWHEDGTNVIRGIYANVQGNPLD